MLLRHWRWAALLSAGMLMMQACSSPTADTPESANIDCSTDPTPPGGSSPPDFSGRTITVQTWGGAVTEAFKKAFFQPFSEATGVEINTVDVTGQTPSRLKAMHDAGNIEWDMITDWGSPATFQMADADLLRKICPSLVPGIKNLVPGAYSGYGVGFLESVMVAGSIRKDGVKPLTSVDDFFNVKEFPGKRAVSNWGDDERNVAAALLADGVPRDELYPLDTDRALRVWDRVKPSVEVWYESGQELVSALVNERVDYCLCWDGRAQQAMATNPKWTYTLEGAYLGFENTAIVNGTKNADVAHALIQYMTDPKRQAVFYQNFNVTPTNPTFIDHLPDDFLTPKTRKFIPTTKENQGKWWTPTVKELRTITKDKRELETQWTKWVSR